MAISPSFTVSQSVLSPSYVTLVDTSTGSDVSISYRRVFFQTAQGTYLVPTGTTTDYVLWPYADASLSTDILNADYGLNILVQWMSAANAVLYSSQNVYCFTVYSESFYYSLTQQQAQANSNLADTNYFNNKQQLRIYIDSANNAVLYGSDIIAAQNSLNSAAYMIDNQNYFF